MKMNKSGLNLFQPHKVNQSKNFIAGWYFTDKSVCDELIDLFNSPLGNKKEGKTANRVDRTRKASTDMSVFSVIREKPVQKYLEQLQSVVEEYKKLYEYSDTNQSNWSINEDFNLQKYEPGEGFYQWHTERNSPNVSNRHLVFMTYLNDIKDQGETEFYYQKIKIKPEKGLTLIWPPDWTFTHRGITSPTETKYIITGWYGYSTEK